MIAEREMKIGEAKAERRREQRAEGQDDVKSGERNHREIETRPRDPLCFPADRGF